VDCGLWWTACDFDVFFAPAASGFWLTTVCLQSIDLLSTVRFCYMRDFLIHEVFPLGKANGGH